MATSYGGVPAGPLSAYLSVRDSNQQSDLRSRQGALSELQMVGALQKMQQEQEGQARLKQFQAEIAAADTPEKQIAVATKYGAPKEVLQFISTSRDRQEAVKAREATASQTDLRMRELAEQQVVARRDIAGQTDTTRRELAAQTDATRRELAARDEALRRELAAGKGAEKAEQKAASADYAELLTGRLNNLLTENPRSVTGILSPLVRATEAVVNSFAPGAIGSQATISSQTKEQLITVLSQLRGGAQGRLSNQDMRRVDTAIGQINSGTQEGMAQGLLDTYDLIDTMQGKPARSGKGITKPIVGSIPLPPPGFKLDQ